MMQNYSETIARLERRIADLESRSSASLRFGRVSAIDGGMPRVEIPDGKDVVSMPLPTVQRRVLRDQEIKLPDVGEPVAVLFSGQGEGQSQGVVLGAVYSPAVPDPGQEQQMEYSKFSDGTTVCYDRNAHKLTAVIKGSAEITADKDVTVKAKGEIKIESDVKITLKAPFIQLAGALVVTDESGGTGHGILNGSFVVKNGNLTAPDGDVKASGISLTEHHHVGCEGSIPG